MQCLAYFRRLTVSVKQAVCLAVLVGATGAMFATAREGLSAEAPAAGESVVADAKPGAAGGLAKAPDFNSDVRPILTQHCTACHGPDSAARKADLRVDDRESVLQSVIVPGHADQSELIRRILSTDPDEVMPPAPHKSLSERERDILRRWVDAGAEYQPHWAFIAPQRPELPAVSNPGWTRNPIDAFVLAELDAASLRPAPEADRRTLARRVGLDLNGLPPSVEDVEAFVADTGADAYERFVEKLMARETWGEHRARYWLDAARYADTHGIHFDNYREMWSYRDWVINAFNANQPFDEFTREQLAGDLLPEPTLAQQVATGFNRCNMTTNEGGIIDEEYLVLYARDRTETTSLVWLGLTTGCAVCHDHKFDPLTQKEFYELSAFFNNTTQPVKDGNRKDTPPIIRLASEDERPRYRELQALVAEGRSEVARIKRDHRSEFDAWLASFAKVAATAEPTTEKSVAAGVETAATTPTSAQQPVNAADTGAGELTGVEPGAAESGATTSRTAAVLPEISVSGLQFALPLNEGTGDSVAGTLQGEPATITAEGPLRWIEGIVAEKALRSDAKGMIRIPAAGDFAGDHGFSCATWVYLEKRNISGPILARMDEGNQHRGWDLWLEGGALASHVIHEWPRDAIKVIAKKSLPEKQWVHVAMTYDGSGTAAGVKLYVNGAAQASSATEDHVAGTLQTSVPLTLFRRTGGENTQGLRLQDVRIYDHSLTASDVRQLESTSRAIWLLSRSQEQRTDKEVQQLFDWWLRAHEPEFVTADSRLAKLEAESTEIEARGTIAHVMNERDEPPMAYVLFRGEYDQRRDAVPAAVPGFLPPAREASERMDRLDLANWLLQEDHPLTARVTMNRYWQEVFGSGLVKSAGDFGLSGTPPSHPELLDWLAVEFRESGWDVKHMFRLMVTSAAYRQSAEVTPEKLAADPDNRLLSRGPRFRMDAEMVRDYALAACGVLSPKVGGPSVRPYQPPGVWEAVAMNGSDTRFYVEDRDDNLRRRSMYWFWKRAAPPASMDIFNAPSREFCVVQRERTNTPLQALVTLNDVQFVEAGRALATKVVAAHTDSNARLAMLAQRILLRPLTVDEQAILSEALGELQVYYAAHPADAEALVNYGALPVTTPVDRVELATWTMMANQLLNLDEVLNK